MSPVVAGPGIRVVPSAHDPHPTYLPPCCSPMHQRPSFYPFSTFRHVVGCAGTSQAKADLERRYRTLVSMSERALAAATPFSLLEQLKTEVRVHRLQSMPPVARHWFRIRAADTFCAPGPNMCPTSNRSSGRCACACVGPDVHGACHWFVHQPVTCALTCAGMYA